MSCLDSFNNLLEKMACHIFSKIIVLYIVIELAPFSQFHDYIDVSSGVEYFKKFDDMWVIDESQNLNLSFDLIRFQSTFDIIFLFFIFDLLMILTATLVPVRSCLASEFWSDYILLWRTLLSL